MKFFKKKTWDDIMNIEDSEDKVQELYKYLSKKSHYGIQLDKLNEYEKKIYLVMEYEVEMNDGGFEQFFYSDISNYVHEVCAALLEIGAYQNAELLQQAIEVFPNGVVPLEQNEREKLLRLLLNDGLIFQELDENYCQLDIQLINRYLDIKNTITNV